MLKFNFLKKSRPALAAPGAAKSKNLLEVKIGSILVRIARSTGRAPENELTVVLPRAEIRYRRYENGCLAEEKEVILSSITLADSPRFPPEKADGPAGRMPPPRQPPSGTTARL
ncbi:MAG: hypothetical protein HPY89_01690 [Pelotomaculum sp.]|nr:hypothetical protein [Pelotomaculum sp.]